MRPAPAMRLCATDTRAATTATAKGLPAMALLPVCTTMV